MALEAVVFQHDPYGYGLKDIYNLAAGGGHCSYGFGLREESPDHHEVFNHKSGGFGLNANSGSSASPVVQTLKEWDTTMSSYSPRKTYAGDGFHEGGLSMVEAPATMSCRRKRRRTKSIKNEKEVENQRMTHIAVERNRRRQMNDYLAVLRSMMPASYVQRGDQASIIGGAINFVKELEQLLQSLEAQKIRIQHSDSGFSSLFSGFFAFPQYSMASSHRHNNFIPPVEPVPEKRSAIANVEVTMVESHANLKILSKRHPKQLFKMVAGLPSLGLSVLHLNVTTAQHMVLYCFSVKVEEDCQLTSVNEMAAAVYEMVSRIQEEGDFIS